MKKSDLLNNINLKTGIPKPTCEMVIDTMIGEITQSLVNGEKVSIKSFMNFELGERAERNARNPSTGEIQKFPAVRTIKCKMSKEIKDAVNNKRGEK